MPNVAISLSPVYQTYTNAANAVNSAKSELSSIGRSIAADMGKLLKNIGNAIGSLANLIKNIISNKSANQPINEKNAGEILNNPRVMDKDETPYEAAMGEIDNLVYRDNASTKGFKESLLEGLQTTLKSEMDKIDKELLQSRPTDPDSITKREAEYNKLLELKPIRDAIKVVKLEIAEKQLEAREAENEAFLKTNFFASEAYEVAFNATQTLKGDIETKRNEFLAGFDNEPNNRDHITHSTGAFFNIPENFRTTIKENILRDIAKSENPEKNDLRIGLAKEIASKSPDVKTARPPNAAMKWLDEKINKDGESSAVRTAIMEGVWSTQSLEYKKGAQLDHELLHATRFSNKDTTALKDEIQVHKKRLEDLDKMINAKDSDVIKEFSKFSNDLKITIAEHALKAVIDSADRKISVLSSLRHELADNAPAALPEFMSPPRYFSDFSPFNRA